MNVNDKEFEREEEKVGGEGEITVKRNKTVDFIAKIVCFLIAFFVWFYAAGTDSTMIEKKFSSVKVEVINDSPFSVISGDDFTIDVTVSGKKSIVKNYSLEDIRAYVDISSITEAGVGRYDVAFDLPNGVELVKSSANSIRVETENTKSESKPVKVEIVGSFIEAGYEIDEEGITTDVTQITVTGPESVLERISCARLSASIGRVTGSVSFTGQIELVDENGKKIENKYLSVDRSHVSANIPVYKYRDVPISYSFKHGIFNSENCTVTLEPQSVRVRGEASKIDSLVLNIEIDEKQVGADMSYPAYQLSLPEGVSASSQEIGINLSATGIATKKITVTRINVLNPKNLIVNPISNSIEITVIGSADKINSLSASNISAIIDLSSLSANSGTVPVQVKFGFSESYNGAVYEVGSYSISVKIIGGSKLK